MARFEHLNNAAESASTAARIAYHGVAAGVARVRAERAEVTAERMEHKERLYLHLGRIATGGADTTFERPQTLAERFVDWRMDRRSRKKVAADNYAHRDRKIYGPDRSTLETSVRQAVVDRSLSVGLSGHDAGDGVGHALVENTKAIFKGPELDGKTNLAKKIDRTSNNIGFIRGKKTARERRMELHKILAVEPKYGNKAHRKDRRDQRRTAELLDHAVEMPITSRWRDMRLSRAERRIRKNKAKIQKHRRAIKDLRS